MNAARRKEIKNILKQLEELDSLRMSIQEQIESVMDREQEAYDNMPEGIQCSERGEAMSEGIDTIQEVIDTLEELDVESLIDSLSEL